MWTSSCLAKGYGRLPPAVAVDSLSIPAPLRWRHRFHALRHSHLLADGGIALQWWNRFRLQLPDLTLRGPAKFFIPRSSSAAAIDRS